MRRYIFFAIAVSLMLIASCSKESTVYESERETVRGISVGPVIEKEIQDYYIAPGTVRAVERSVISSRIMGEVRDILVKSGSNVTRGQVVIRIDSPELLARRQVAEEAVGEAERALDMARSRMQLAEKTFTRYRTLFSESVITEQEYDEVLTSRDLARTGYERSRKALAGARASLRAVEAQLAYGVVRSPVNGIVAETDVDVGSTVMPGQPLLTIEEMPYRIESYVDEKILPFIKTGMSARAEVAALGSRLACRVSEVVHRIDPRTRTFTVKLNITEPPGGLRGGMYARMSFPTEKRRAIFVRDSAIVRRGDLVVVYAVDDRGIISMRFVRIGESRDGMTEILSGLRPGEQVIISGTDKAVDGGIAG